MNVWLFFKRLLTSYKIGKILKLIFFSWAVYKFKLTLNWFITDDASKGEKETASMFENLGESIEFAGMAVAHLAQDPKKLDKTGRVLLTCNLAREYGFQDLDGSIHDVLSIKLLLNSYVIIS